MSQPRYVVRPASSPWLFALRETWLARRLLWVFVWRDVRVRYKHTFLGALWNIIQPLGLMAVYTLVFGILFTGRMGEVEYPLFLFPAILLWQLFSKGVSSGATSLSNLQGVLSKVYFPRMIAPAAAVISGLFDLFVSSTALIALMILYGSWPTWQALFAPVFLGLTLLFTFSVSLWLSALDAQYKDVRHTLQFTMLLWMFATPVMYPLSLIPEHLQTLYYLNPMVGLVQGFRWSLTPGTTPPTAEMMIPSMVLLAFSLLTGVLYFSRHEGTIVDTV